MNQIYKFDNTNLPNEDFSFIGKISSEWKIDTYSSDFIFREVYPINDKDEIFCGILHHFGGKMSESEFAYILGFSIKDSFEKKMYADEAEKYILDQMLKECELYGLIKRNQEDLELTEDGLLSIESRKKYRYWQGSAYFFENQCFQDNTFFDYNKHFDLSIQLPFKKENKDNKLTNPEKEKFQLVKFQLLQNSDEKFELWHLEKYSKSGNRNPKVHYACFRNNDNDTIILVLQNEIVNAELTYIINDVRNIQVKNDLVLRCEFKTFMDNPNEVIDADTIEKFEKLWDNKELITDGRLQWSDNEIWNIFDKKFNKNEWALISQIAPENEIKLRLHNLSTRFDWISLSSRFDDDYVYDNFLKDNFYWDFEILSTRDIDFVWLLISVVNNKNRLNQGNFTNANWDFIGLTERFSDNQVLLLILEKMPLDFIQISSRSTDFVITCLKEIKAINENSSIDNKYIANFDWSAITNKWSIDDIWNNIELLEPKLNWYSFLNRIFSDVQYSESFINSKLFKEKLEANKNNISPTFKTEKLLWSEPLIDLFNELEILYWSTNDYSNGFECNPHIDWIPKLFDKYKHLFSTSHSKDFISRKINSWNFIDSFPDFEWNWQVISKNKSLEFDTDILLKHRNSLDWTELSKRFEDDFILEHLLDFEWDFHDTLSKKTIDFILLALGFDGVIEKNWNWKFLTKILPKEFVKENLIRIGSKWDWIYLTQTQYSVPEIISLWETTVEYWDWNYILEKAFSVTDLANIDTFSVITYNLNKIKNEELRKKYWSVLTKKVPPTFIADNNYSKLRSRDYQWDWTYLSQHPSFDYTLDFVQKFEKKWDWNILSKNKKINYDWTYLTKFYQYWDWSYISEFSTFIFFKRKLDYKTIVRFQNHIDFSAFSKRKDIEIDHELIDKFSNQNWDFAYLSSIKSLLPTQEFFRKYADKNWDWKLLSQRKDLRCEIKYDEDNKEIKNKFINELILEFQDKDWDWEYLSTRKDINFTFTFINELITKNWNFMYLTIRKDIVWSKELLHLLKNKGLDWNYLSESSAINELNSDYINTFSTYWDWNLLSTNEKFTLDEKLLLLHQDKWNFMCLTKRKDILSIPKCIIELIDKDWDWEYISEEAGLELDSVTLDKLKEKLNWNLLSTNSKIKIDISLLEKFEDYWNFIKLNNNSSHFSVETRSAINQYFAKRPKLKFLLEIDKQNSRWKGYIYHFSHLSNAVKILKDMAIKSRNTARQINNSAGTVVNSRDTAKNYARFYFRPQTPAQFYNENMGKSPDDDYTKTWIYKGREYSSNVREYSKAANMGFPKCPAPIFFKIDIKEVLDYYQSSCYISNGNMQSNWAKIFQISDEGIVAFNFEDLYIESSFKEKEIYKEYSQQEFLVSNQLDLTNLKSLEIICQNEIDKEALLNLIGQNHPFADKVCINRSYYHQKHSRYNIRYEDKELNIDTHFSGTAKTIVKLDKQNCIESIEGDIYRNRPYIIEGGKNIQIKFNTEVNFQVCYIDESNQEWLLYATTSFD